METCFGPSAWNAGCWDVKHISDHDVWRRFEKRGAMLSFVIYWPVLEAGSVQATWGTCRTQIKQWYG